MYILIPRHEIVLVKIIYFMPDYRHLLNEFFYQLEDLVPDIPRVHHFLNHWKNNIEAPIREVLIGYSGKRFSIFNNVDHVGTMQ